MLRWFRAFLPKEERFFELFARHAQTAVQGALALQDMLKGGDETPVYCQRVNQFEKPFFLWQKIAKPAQQHRMSISQKRPAQSRLSHNCHKPFPGKARGERASGADHPPLCKVGNGAGFRAVRSVFKQRW